MVGDGVQQKARDISGKMEAVEYHDGPESRCWGHAQRNFGMEKATGTHLAFLDDDDVWLTGARRQLGAAMKDHPDRPVFFRMEHHYRVLWADPEIRYGNVSTQMYLFPNHKGHMATWKPNPSDPDGRGGDFLFAMDTVALYQKAPVFVDAIIAKLFYHSKGQQDLY